MLTVNGTCRAAGRFCSARRCLRPWPPEGQMCLFCFWTRPALGPRVRSFGTLHGRISTHTRLTRSKNTCNARTMLSGPPRAGPHRPSHPRPIDIALPGAGAIHNIPSHHWYALLSGHSQHTFTESTTHSALTHQTVYSSGGRITNLPPKAPKAPHSFTPIWLAMLSQLSRAPCLGRPPPRRRCAYPCLHLAC